MEEGQRREGNGKRKKSMRRHKGGEINPSFGGMIGKSKKGQINIKEQGRRINYQSSKSIPGCQYFILFFLIHKQCQGRFLFSSFFILFLYISALLLSLLLSYLLLHYFIYSTLLYSSLLSFPLPRLASPFPLFSTLLLCFLSAPLSSFS